MTKNRLLFGAASIAVVLAACVPVPTNTTTDAAPPAEVCTSPSQCASGYCREGVCLETAPADGVKNGDETDVDCGGTKAPPCPDAKHCLAAADCTSNVCAGEVCQAPTHT